MDEDQVFDAVATAVGTRFVYSEMAFGALVHAIAKQPNIDGKQLIRDVLANLTPAPGHEDHYETLRLVLQPSAP